MSIVHRWGRRSTGLTAMGLLVAVPAVIAFNYFTKKVEHFINDMELCGFRINRLIGGE